VASSDYSPSHQERTGPWGDGPVHGNERSAYWDRLNAAFTELIRSLLGKPGPKTQGGPPSHRWTIKDIGHWEDGAVGIRKSEPIFQKIRTRIEACKGYLDPEFAAYLTWLAEQFGDQAYGHLERLAPPSIALYILRWLDPYNELIKRGQPDGAPRRIAKVSYDLHFYLGEDDGVLIGPPPAYMEWLKAVEALSTSDDEIGWVTYIPDGLSKYGASPLACALFQRTQDELRTTSVIGEPFVGWVVATTENSSEFLLQMAMFIWALLPKWQAAQLDCAVQRSKDFLGWVHAYFANPDNFESATAQLALVPSDSNRTPSKEVLWGCLQAALTTPIDQAAWPAYDFGRWNSVRMHVKHHPLLPAGESAHFLKKARPIGDPNNLLGFEVTWAPQNTAAIRLLEALREQVRRQNQARQW
jgi:hypothetical protein